MSPHDVNRFLLYFDLRKAQNASDNELVEILEDYKEHEIDEKYEERVKEEYDVIVGADLENYFLIIWDILHWCKNNNILTGLARGSAAGSFIMFLLDIVKINPFDYDFCFSF